MTGPFDTLASLFLWSKFGGAELIVGILVGLLLLAFALPARFHAAAEDEPSSRAPDLAGSRRR